jgi:hypothetical protein
MIVKYNNYVMFKNQTTHKNIMLFVSILIHSNIKPIIECIKKNKQNK